MPRGSKPARVEERLSLSQADFDRFAQLSGDHNPIHVDPVFAAETLFGATVSHGMLLFTILRGSIERHYPGARLEAQDLMFPAPTYAGETLTLVLAPLDSALDDVLVLATEVIKADGRRGLQGQCRLHLTGDAAP